MKRRQFLRNTNLAALGSTGVMSSLFNLRMAGNAIADGEAPSDYKALVCLFLAGGNDSFNMLVPEFSTDPNSEWKRYQDARESASLADETGAVVSLGNSDLALHEGMAGPLKSFYDAEELAFVSNVGTLVEPITAMQFLDRDRDVPLGLFSHSDQINQWQTSLPQRTSRTGWAGRMADFLHPLHNGNQQLSMNISYGGNNIFQVGDQVTSYTAGGLQDLRADTVNRAQTAAALGSLVDSPEGYWNLFDEAFRKQTKQSRELLNRYDAIVANSGAVGGLGATADAINAFCAEGSFKRQTYFVLWGGWDDHSGISAGKHGARLTSVGNAISSFWSTLDAELKDQVTLFTASDFGRALKPNGNGTDHAWGGNQLVSGGAVQGGKIYGDYPDMPVDSSTPADLDIGKGNGRFLPTTSTDAYFAELALWFGVPPGEMSTVLPNIDNFYGGQPGDFVANHSEFLTNPANNEVTPINFMGNVTP